MADDWEENDWEKEDFTPQLAGPKPAAATGQYETKGAALLAAIEKKDVDMSKFADEDKEDEQEDPLKKHYVPPPQPKKKEEKKYKELAPVEDETLDDPVLEKLRQQRLVEQADFAAARELFDGAGGGSGGGAPGIDDFLPKTLKDFEELATKLVARYVTPHREAKHYKAFVKALARAAVGPLPSEETKDVETMLAGLRSDKVKAEKEAKAAKPGAKKGINLGRSTKSGLEDFGDMADDFNGDGETNDDYDFM